ncbi:MAG TPA: hypothetical protein VFQ76_16510, partial [Longimicrobiaceae bacterium]|nr:hypothetical protein [Longimicrobiaceae bacterium]
DGRPRGPRPGPHRPPGGWAMTVPPGPAASIRAGGAGMRIARVAAVTVGLAAAGAGVGAVVGVLVPAIWLLSAGGGLGLLLNLDTVLFIGAYGAAIGAVLGPLAAWLLMRHVPLWKAIGGTALGTLAGSLPGLVGDGQMGFAGAFLGFAAAAVYRRFRSPRERRRIGAPAARVLPPG